MVFSWQTFLIGAVLGIIQFGIGLWIGKVVFDRRKQRRSQTSPASEKVTGTELVGQKEVQESAQRLQTVTTRLQSTVNRVTNDVSNHQIRIEQMTRELHAFKKRSVSITEEVIWERLNQLLRMTTDFSNRLSDAESRIQVQSKQIDMLATAQKTLPGIAALGEETTSADDYSKKIGIQPVESSGDTVYYPDTPESLITDETVDSVTSLGSGVYSADEDSSKTGQEATAEQDKQTVPDDGSEVDSVVENVRSRLSEVVSSRPSE